MSNVKQGWFPGVAYVSSVRDISGLCDSDRRPRITQSKYDFLFFFRYFSTSFFRLLAHAPGYGSSTKVFLLLLLLSAQSIRFYVLYSRLFVWQFTVSITVGSILVLRGPNVVSCRQNEVTMAMSHGRGTGVLVGNETCMCALSAFLNTILRIFCSSCKTIVKDFVKKIGEQL